MARDEAELIWYSGLALIVLYGLSEYLIGVYYD